MSDYGKVDKQMRMAPTIFPLNVGHVSNNEDGHPIIYWKYKMTHAVPTVVGRYFYKDCHILLDTGATDSIIKGSWYDALPLKGRPGILRSPIRQLWYQVVAL